MVSRSTVRECCSTFAFACAGKPQHRNGGGTTTRAPTETSTCSAAIDTCDWSRSEPQPGK